MPVNFLRKNLKPLFVLIGLGVVATLLHQLGLNTIWELFTRVGWRIIYVLLLPLGWYLVQTVAWHLILKETSTHISFIRLLLIKIIGETVNTSTPVGFLGGDPVRISFLSKSMPANLATASVVLDRTIHTLATVILLLGTIIAALWQLSLPPLWRTLFLGVVLLLVFLTLFVLYHQQQGGLIRLHGALKKWGVALKLLEKIEHQIIQMDERITTFYKHDHRRFWLVLIIHIIGRLGGVLEIALIASLMHLNLSWSGSFFLATLAILVNIVFVFIPGTLGVMEGAYGALCVLLKIEAISGVTLQLIRRIRSVFWIAVGNVILLFMTHKKPLQSLHVK